MDPREKFTELLQPELVHSWQAVAGNQEAAHKGASVIHWRVRTAGSPICCWQLQQGSNLGTRERSSFLRYALQCSSTPYSQCLTLCQLKKEKCLQGPAPASQSRANNGGFGAERQYIDNWHASEGWWECRCSLYYSSYISLSFKDIINLKILNNYKLSNF